MISDNDIQFIITHRPPLSKRAKKLLAIIQSKGGKIKCTHASFCRGLGLWPEFELFYIRLEECIAKDYVRVYESKSVGADNWYFTFEYFHSAVLPNLGNPEVYEFHNQYISQKVQEVQSRKVSH